MSAAIHAGMLRERVTFQTSARIEDALGGYSETWQDDVTLWAHVGTVKATLEQIDARHTPSIRKRIIIRSSSHDIRANMRCLIDGKPHRILWITPYGDVTGFKECHIIDGGYHDPAE